MDWTKRRQYRCITSRYVVLHKLFHFIFYVKLILLELLFILFSGYEGIPFDYPYHYDLTYVHFLPKGYLNGQTVRISYLGNSKFSFLNETILNTWFRKLYFEETQIEAPKVILDVGTGTGGSAFVLGEIFPEANVRMKIYI